MLLYLLLLLPLVQADPLADCDIDYKCYSTKNCKENRPLVDVLPDETLDSNCFVILKLHPFSSQKTQLVMESLDDSTYSIELLTRDNTVILTCTTENGITKAFQGRAGDKSIKLINQGTESENLRCEFDFDFSGHRLLGSSPGKIILDGIILKTQGQQEYTTTESTINAKVYCSPDVLVTSEDNIFKNKSYAKAEYKAGHVKCPNPKVFSTIEYRLDEKNGYEQIKGLNCENNPMNPFLPKIFVVLDNNGNSIPIPTDDDIDIRCVADVEYFCDYDLKYTEKQQNLSRVKSNLTTDPPKKGKIECPSTHKIFVINGQYHTENVEIKCQNHGGKMKWTFNETILTETGPQVHCVKKLECHVMNKMTRANLEGSFLDENHMPKCQEEGKLSVKEGTAGETFRVNQTLCEPSNGQYYYTIDDQTTKHQVSKNTIFFCKYEESRSDGNTATNWYFVAEAIGTVVIAAAIAIPICWYVMLKRKRRDEALRNLLAQAEVQNSERFEKNVESTDDALNDERDLLANDYLQKKRLEAKSAVLYDVLPKEIPDNTNRVMEKVGREFYKNHGLRYAEDREIYAYRASLHKQLSDKVRFKVWNQLEANDPKTNTLPVDGTSASQNSK